MSKKPASRKAGASFVSFKGQMVQARGTQELLRRSMIPLDPRLVVCFRLRKVDDLQWRWFQEALKVSDVFVLRCA